jgi:uncharacterized protein (TIRG00374 family)
VSIPPLARVFIIAAVMLLVVLFAWRALDISALVRAIDDIPVTTLWLLAGITILLAVNKALRFGLLIRRSHIDASLWQAMRAYMAGQALTPLPGGETYRIALLKREADASLPAATSTLALQAGLEYLVAIPLALVGSIAYTSLRIPALLAALALSLVIALLFSERLSLGLVERLHFVWGMKRLYHFLQEARSHLIVLVKSRYGHWRPSSTMLQVILLALLGQLLGATMLVILARSLGASMSFSEGLFLYASSIVLTMVSGFIPGGLGVQEGGLAALLALLRLSWSQIMPLVVVYRFFDLIFYVAMGGIIWLIFYARDSIRGEAT